MKKVLKKSVAVLLSFIMVLSLCSCQSETDVAEAMVKEMLESIKNVDEETIEKFIDVERYVDTYYGEGLFVNADEMEEIMYDRFSYEVLSSMEVNPGMINVSALITNIDMSYVATDFAKKLAAYTKDNPNVTEEQLSAKMKELFKECALVEELPLVTTETIIRVEEKGKDWEIIPTSDIENAVLGGLLNFFETNLRAYEFEMASKVQPEDAEETE